MEAMELLGLRFPLEPLSLVFLLSSQGGKAESCAAREARCTCMPRTSMEAMELLGLRFPLEQALHLPTSTREMEVSTSVSTVTELPTRARCTRPLTWPSCGTFRPVFNRRKKLNHYAMG